MTLEVDYVLWDLERKKIKKFKTIVLHEEDILEMMKRKYDNDELPIPININKDEVYPEFEVRGGSF